MAENPTEIVASSDPRGPELLARHERDRTAAQEDPLAFWAAQARKLEWAKPFTQVLDESRRPFFKWFADGQLNLVASAVDRHARSAKRDKAAFIWLSEDCKTRTVVTYGQLHERVCRAANALRSLGIRKGDTVVIYMPLTLEAVTAMLACARIGAVHSVVYAGLAAPSLRARIEDAKAVAVLTAECTFRRGKPVPLAAIAEEALSEGCATVRDLVLWRRTSAAPPKALGPARRRHDWDAINAHAAVEAPLEIVDAEHPLFILYTSGTTGKPKGVVHVHGGYGAGTAYHMRTFWDVGENEVFWCTSDIGWIVGHSYIVYAPLIEGVTTLFREGAIDYPGTDIAYRIIEEEKVNVLFTAPTTVRFLMKYGDKPAQARDLKSLRWLTVAGEPLNPEAFRWGRRLLCGDGAWGNLGDNWWQTETAAPCLATPPGARSKLGAAGVALPGIAPAIISLNGGRAPVDTAGDLYLERPFPHLFRTVFGDDARFASAWDANGYRTGDAAQIDADGYVQIIGRTDDVIKVAGHRIGSAELESALVAHPMIAEAAAIGLPDALKGEKICCFVTLRAGFDPPPDPLAFFGEHVRKTMGTLATPASIKVVAALPKTRSGKIMRRLLRARELGQPEGDVSTLDG